MDAEVFEFLRAQGISDDEIAAAESEGRAGSLLTDRIAGPARHTLEDISSRSGLPVALLARIWRAAGLPDQEPAARAFTDSDAEALTVFALGASVFGEAPFLQLMRVIGSSLSRIAEAELLAALTNVEDAVYDTASSPLGALQTSARLLDLLGPAEQAIAQLLRRHVVVANRRIESMRQSGPGADLREVAVGFADLTGSTSLAVELPWQEFAAVIAEFEALTTEVIMAGGGRVVKLVGDGVMFVAVEPGRACEIALTLLDVAGGRDELPALRAGVANGPAVVRDGDYLGAVVSLAARLVDTASPGTLLVPADLAIALPRERFASEALGARNVRGFPQPVDVCRITRPA